MKTVKSSLKIHSLLLTLSLVFTGCLAIAQEEPKMADKEKSTVIDSIQMLMSESYVFPETGEKMGDLLVQNLKSGKYDEIDDYHEFAQILTSDLRSVSNDKHIGVIYSPERIAMQKNAENEEGEKELEDYIRRIDEAGNYNFKELKILPGNVGYLKFDRFPDASIAGETAIAALGFLAHTDALIIDLRDNGGGNPSMIQLITSYFFEDSEHLNSFYIRDGNRTTQFWTLPFVPGKKLVNTDLYILTSNYTFSGAEEFSYNLKNLERATLVGETTGGGAHPVERHIINDNFAVSVPFGRAINPITNSNWEGTGVEPDVKVSREEAMDVAYQMALEKRLENETLDELKSEVAWTLEGLEAAREGFYLDADKMMEYQGMFGPRSITYEDGQLYYQREDRPKMKMIPMKKDLFKFDEIDYFRLKFLRENGQIIAVEGRYDNGKTDRNERS